MMEIDRKQILIGLLETIQCISDKDYQRRVWIRGEGPESDDFDETVCHFSLEGDGVIEKYKDFNITETQHQALRKFRDEFKNFYHANDWLQEFIDTPEWENITEMAKDVLKVFHYSKTETE